MPLVLKDLFTIVRLTKALLLCFELCADHCFSSAMTFFICIEFVQIQKIVISGGHFRPDALKPKEVVSLLLDDDEMQDKCKADAIFCVTHLPVVFTF